MERKVTLLTIPREIRNKIFKLVASDQDVFKLKKESASRVGRSLLVHECIIFSSRLVAVSHQIALEYAEEATKIAIHSPLTQVKVEIKDGNTDVLEDFTNALRPHELNSITVHKKVDIIMALYLKGTPVWQRARVWAWRLSTNLRAPHNQWFWECWFSQNDSSLD